MNHFARLLRIALCAATALIAACKSGPTRPDASQDPYGAQLATFEAIQDMARAERQARDAAQVSIAAQCPQCPAGDPVCTALATVCVTSVSRDFTLTAGGGGAFAAGGLLAAGQSMPAPPPPAPSKWRQFTGGLMEITHGLAPIASMWMGDRANARLVRAQVDGQQIDAWREVSVSQTHSATAVSGFTALQASNASTAQVAGVGFQSIERLGSAAVGELGESSQAWATTVGQLPPTTSISAGGNIAIAGRDQDQSSTGRDRVTGDGNETGTITTTECYATATGAPVNVTAGTTGSATGGTTGSPTVPGSANAGAQPGNQAANVTCTPRGQ